MAFFDTQQTILWNIKSRINSIATFKIYINLCTVTCKPIPIERVYKMKKMSTLLCIKPTKWDNKTSALITGCSNEEETNNALNEDEQFDLFC